MRSGRSGCPGWEYPVHLAEVKIFIIFVCRIARLIRVLRAVNAEFRSRGGAGSNHIFLVDFWMAFLQTAGVMPRKLRVQYPGAIYHLMNRGDRREAIFEDDQDRHRFLKTLAETCEKTGWQVHAYCLMSNHFHLVPRRVRLELSH